LSFAEALQADMSRIPGWESTAEFLDLAERKANAELRIATGASLLLALGDPSVRAQVQTVIDHAARRGAPDLDSVIAERVLAWAREQGVIR
jgi:basic membrane lipoprotein Med (substrate-binding protein (PBP1-ABC) superfamily)